MKTNEELKALWRSGNPSGKTIDAIIDRLPPLPAPEREHVEPNFDGIALHFHTQDKGPKYVANELRYIYQQGYEAGKASR